MKRATVANILGALAQALTDEVHSELDAVTSYSRNSAAALVHLSKYSGEPIESLRVPLGLSQPGCVRLVDRLEQDGLVRRTTGADRRSRNLSLTKKGERSAAAVLDARNEALGNALSSLSSRECKTLAELTTRVLIAMVASPDDALMICRLCDYESCPDASCPSALALADA